MNKIKLLMPVIGVSAIAGTIVPVAISCNPADPDVPVVDAKVTLNYEEVFLESGSKDFALTATLEPADAGELVWESVGDFQVGFTSTEDILTKKIDVPAKLEDGEVTEIRVSIRGTKIYDSCIVHIGTVGEPNYVKIDNDGGKEDTKEIGTNVGDYVQLVARVYDADGREIINPGATFTWSIKGKTYGFTIDSKTGKLVNAEGQHDFKFEVVVDCVIGTTFNVSDTIQIVPVTK